MYGRSYSGRGRGGRGRGGRGRGGRGFYNNMAKQEFKFHPLGAGKGQQTIIYDDVKDAIIGYVLMTYEYGGDITECLRYEKMIDLMKHMPKKEISAETDAATKKEEQEMLDLIYSEEINRFVARSVTLKDNLIKVFALIKDDYCTKTMQTRLEELEDYESKIRNDPIELLKAIKVLMHGPTPGKYEHACFFESIKRFINIRQMEHESLIDFLKRFKQHRDVFVSQVGNRLLDGYVENTEAYKNETDDDKKESMKKEEFSKFEAYVFMQAVDQTKYGSLTTGLLITQFSMGNNQYPATLNAAVEILRHHRFDDGWKKKRDSRKKKHNE